MYAPYDAFLSWPGLQPLNEKVMVLQAEKSSYIKLDMGLSPPQIAQLEAKAMYSKQMVIIFNEFYEFGYFFKFLDEHILVIF